MLLLHSIYCSSRFCPLFTITHLKRYAIYLRNPVFAIITVIQDSWRQQSSVAKSQDKTQPVTTAVSYRRSSDTGRGSTTLLVCSSFRINGAHSDCNNYRGISLVVHAGKALLKIVASCLSNDCETGGILHEEQCGFRPARSSCLSCANCKNSDELWKYPFTCASSTSRRRMYDSVDQKLLGLVLVRFGVSGKMKTVICPFYEGMRARVRTDDGEHSEWFGITQGLRQECVLSPLLFNIFFAAVIHAVPVRFSEDLEILKDLVHLEEDLEEDKVGVNADPPTCVRRAVCGVPGTLRRRCRNCV